MSTDLAPRTVEEMQILDVYAGGVSDEAPRIDALATISAGYREAGKDGHVGLPKASRDGTIYLHDKMGRAPGLKAALAVNGNKRLTIAFPVDDPNAFIQQHFMSYSATALLAYGDAESVKEIKDGKHHEYLAGTDNYKRVVNGCKVSVSVYFALAEWDKDGLPQVVFPDGFGFYRLRFTSRHSLRSIIAGLRSTSRFTRDRIAGVPFELALDYREVADKTGAKRTIPVWTICLKPPERIALTSRTAARILGQGLREGEALMLPAPRPETLEAELAEERIEVDLDEPSEEQAAVLEQGGTCDVGYHTKLFFGSVKGTSLEGDKQRAELVSRYTNGHTTSLSEFLAGATEREATLFGVWVREELELQAAPPANVDRETGEVLDTATPREDGDSRAGGEVCGEGAEQASAPPPPPETVNGQATDEDEEIQDWILDIKTSARNQEAAMTNGYVQATEKQLNYLKGLLHVTKDQRAIVARLIYGRASLEELSRGEASALIDLANKDARFEGRIKRLVARAVGQEEMAV